MHCNKQNKNKKMVQPNAHRIHIELFWQAHNNYSVASMYVD